MDQFTIAYQPEPAREMLAKGTRMRTLLMVSAVLFTLLVVINGFATWNTVRWNTRNSDELGALQVLALLLFGFLAFACGSAVALNIYTIVAIGKARKQPPPHAVRLTTEGVTIFGILSGDCFLPWPAVQEVSASTSGLRVVAVPDAVSVPGSVAAGSLDANTLQKQMKKRGGLPWKVLQPIDLQHLDDALRHFSQGRISLGRA